MIKNFPIYFTLLISMALSNIKEPDYLLIEKDGSIEIRQYSEYIIAKTSVKQGNIELNNNMFRTLAGYIFGGNIENKSIPMTAPVITKSNDSSYDMIFFMLDAENIDDLPISNNPDVLIEKMKIGKTISIKFGMWATDKRVNYYKEKLDKYIQGNNIEVQSDLMVAQYNSPLTIPPFRKNELIYQIK